VRAISSAHSIRSGVAPTLKVTRSAIGVRSRLPWARSPQRRVALWVGLWRAAQGWCLQVEPRAIVLKGITVAAGANNLFNRYPNQLNPALTAAYYAYEECRRRQVSDVLALRHRWWVLLCTRRLSILMHARPVRFCAIGGRRRHAGQIYVRSASNPTKIAGGRRNPGF
jgi:hypothetical protein